MKGCDITENLLAAAASNQRYGYKIVALLLSSGETGVRFPYGVATPKVLEAAVAHRLLDHEDNKSTIQITENVIVAAACGWNSEEVLHVLLSKRKNDTCFPDGIATPMVLEAGAKGIGGPQVMRLLLDHEENKSVIQITENVIVAAAGNERFPGMVPVLFTKWKKAIRFSCVFQIMAMLPARAIVRTVPYAEVAVPVDAHLFQYSST
jgi:hypothetical protein